MTISDYHAFIITYGTISNTVPQSPFVLQYPPVATPYRFPSWSRIRPDCGSDPIAYPVPMSANTVRSPDGSNLNTVPHPDRQSPSCHPPVPPGLSRSGPISRGATGLTIEQFWSRTLPVHQRQHGLGIPLSRRRIRGKHFINPPQVFLVSFTVERAAHSLRDTSAASSPESARYRHPCASTQASASCEAVHPFLAGHLFHAPHQIQILLKILALKARRLFRR